MSQIAKALGVRVPTLYSHISSKQELLAEIMVTTTRRVWLDYEEAVMGIDAADERLRRAIEIYVQGHLTHPREALIVNRDLSSLEEPTRTEVIELRRRHERAVRALIEEGQRTGIFSVEHSALASFAMLEMGVSVVRWFRNDGALTIQQVATQYGRFAVQLVSV